MRTLTNDNTQKSQKENLVGQEIKETLQKVKSCEFLSCLFLVAKKDAGYRPKINRKNLNPYIPYLHFKMEGLSVLKDLSQKMITSAR